MATNREIFNNIAQSWYGYRHYSRFQTELQQVASRWKTGKLLNIGCGHGADFLPFRTGFKLHGLDFSVQMVKQARRYAQKFEFNVELVVADAQYLPYRNGSFENVIAVAVYHHIRGKKERQIAFTELRRILKPGAEAFITVWNKWQPRFWFQPKETYVPWKTRNQEFKRYYYLFSYGELERIIRKSGFEIIRIFPESKYKFPMKYFSQNICILVKAI